MNVVVVLVLIVLVIVFARWRARRVTGGGTTRLGAPAARARSAGFHASPERRDGPGRKWL